MHNIYQALQTQALEVHRARGQVTFATFPSPASAIDFRNQADDERLWANPILQPLVVQNNRVWFLR